MKPSKLSVLTRQVFPGGVNTVPDTFDAAFNAA
jgi:hypothetical protein